MIFLSQFGWYCVYWDKEMIAGRLRRSNGHQSLKTCVPFLANVLNLFEHVRLVSCRNNSVLRKLQSHVIQLGASFYL